MIQEVMAKFINEVMSQCSSDVMIQEVMTEFCPNFAGYVMIEEVMS